MDLIRYIEYGVGGVLAIFCLYQIFYLFHVLFAKKQELYEPKMQHRISVVISARNEEKVIGQLIDSIHAQNYPSELVKTYVIADNCTDRTADIAREKGAIVYERTNDQLVGKGYALDYLFQTILKTDDVSEAFIVLDADNVLDPNYIKEMNRTFDQGYRVITSYRNSKNYGTNWITAGYSLWFLRESKYLNQARMQLRTSCAISGTGFLLKRDIVQQMDGWKYFLLTEDIEFTVDHAIKGEIIGYSENAMLYDEQPITFRQSWDQRMRWTKGYYQIFRKYSFSLLKSSLKGSFSCFDIMMITCPALFSTLFCLGTFFARIIYALLIAENPQLLVDAAVHAIPFLILAYISLFLLGAVTVVTEWKKIRCKPWKIIFHLFTFPFFMATYVPIAIVALFKKVKWKPIEHTVVLSDDEVTTGKNE